MYRLFVPTGAAGLAVLLAARALSRVARRAATRARVAADDLVTCGDDAPGQAGAVGGSRFATGIEGLAAAIRRALGRRSPSRDLVEAMRLADPGGTMAREIGRVRAELPAAVLDLRGGCPMIEPACPDRCACPVNLWTWARPRMAAALAALGEVGEPESFTCPRCGMTSHSPDNVREGYCGNCHDWTRPVEPGEANP